MTTINPTSSTSAVVEGDKTTRVLDDKYGANKTKGGQLVQSSFTDSVISSYANIVYSPVICFTYLVIIMVIIVEMHEPKKGPLETALERVKRMVDHQDKMIQAIGKVFVILLELIVKNKFIFLTTVLFAVPWYRKPSSKNLVASFIFFVLAFAFDLKAFPLLFLSQMWYLYTEIRNPKYKLMLMVITVVAITFVFLETPKGDKTTPPKNFTLSSGLGL